MTRYRPPRSAGTALITPEGEARLRAELQTAGIVLEDSATGTRWRRA